MAFVSEGECDKNGAEISSACNDKNSQTLAGTNGHRDKEDEARRCVSIGAALNSGMKSSPNLRDSAGFGFRKSSKLAINAKRIADFR